jgi:hypothetical protein
MTLRMMYENWPENRPKLHLHALASNSVRSSSSPLPLQIGQQEPADQLAGVATGTLDSVRSFARTHVSAVPSTLLRVCSVAENNNLTTLPKDCFKDLKQLQRLCGRIFVTRAAEAPNPILGATSFMLPCRSVGNNMLTSLPELPQDLLYLCAPIQRCCWGICARSAVLAFRGAPNNQLEEFKPFDFGSDFAAMPTPICPLLRELYASHSNLGPVVP